MFTVKQMFMKYCCYDFKCLLQLGSEQNTNVIQNIFLCWKTTARTRRRPPAIMNRKGSIILTVTRNIAQKYNPENLPA